MTAKTIRPLEDIMKDLTKTANDINSKKTHLEDLNAQQSKAATELDKAQRDAAVLRVEMEEYLNLLVPASVQGRIRQS